MDRPDFTPSEKPHYHKAADGQHWVYDDSGWRAVTRIAWQAGHDRQRKELEERLFKSGMAFQGNPEGFLKDEFGTYTGDWRKVAEYNYVPWGSDWPDGSPWNLSKTDYNDMYVFEWSSPFDGMLDDNPTRWRVAISAFEVLNAPEFRWFREQQSHSTILSPNKP